MNLYPRDHRKPSHPTKDQLAKAKTSTGRRTLSPTTIYLMTKSTEHDATVAPPTKSRPEDVGSRPRPPPNNTTIRTGVMVPRKAAEN